MNKTLLTLSCCLALGAMASAADERKADADNTGKNARDRGAETKTSGDQSEDKSDIQISAAIRREVVKDKSLSTNAHNVKIITKDGMTTLRGPVKSEEEKTKIGEYATKGGSKKVTNEIEVEKAK
jgi:hyperosmotically inducible protein